MLGAHGVSSSSNADPEKEEHQYRSGPVASFKTGRGAAGLRRILCARHGDDTDFWNIVADKSFYRSRFVRREHFATGGIGTLSRCDSWVAPRIVALRIGSPAFEIGIVAGDGFVPFVSDDITALKSVLPFAW